MCLYIEMFCGVFVMLLIMIGMLLNLNELILKLCMKYVVVSSM